MKRIGSSAYEKIITNTFYCQDLFNAIIEKKINFSVGKRDAAFRNDENCGISGKKGR